MNEIEKGQTEEYKLFKKCKIVGRKIKAQRVPSIIAADFGKQIPARPVADQLVDGYFRTFETVFRILHVPTFWQDYRRYWDDPAAASVVFVIQLQLVMAIGTTFYDTTCSLRHLAIQWTYEAQWWLMSPAEKSRINVPGLQITCLLHLARETSGIGGDLVWISAGGLLRTAMFIGLHRDPSKLPNVSHFLAEIRRRLWATILEIALQSSLDSGGPPLVSLDDFDTQPPANFNDDQLVARRGTSPTAPKPLTSFTQTSVQIALLKSFPLRLAIARYNNNFRTANSFSETLRLSSELTAACGSLAAMLQSYRPDDGLGRLRPSAFQLKFTTHITHRIFLSLHQIWLTAAHRDPRYYFSRKVSVETSLKLYRGWDPSNPSQESTERPLTEELSDFTRLTISSAGGFRTVPLQCYGTLGVELLWQLEEEHSVRSSLGIHADTDEPASDGLSAEPSLVMPGLATRAVLLDVLEHAAHCAELRILAGQTNIKELLFVRALVAEALALRRGGSDDEIEKAVLEAAGESIRHALELLREVESRRAPASIVTPAPTLSTLDTDSTTTPATAILDAFTPAGRSQLGFDMDIDAGGEWGWEELVSTATPCSGVHMLIYLVLLRCRTRYRTSTSTSISSSLFSARYEAPWHSSPTAFTYGSPGLRTRCRIHVMAGS